LQGPDVPTAWTINAFNAGTAPFVAGGFSQIANLKGGADVDTFTFTTGGSLSGTIDGGGAPAGSAGDTLQGPDANTAWTINAPNAGTATFVPAGFVRIENLQGGAGVDTFTFTTSGSLSGTIAGGTAPAGSAGDTLQGPDVPTTWAILGPNAGKAPFVPGGFSQIENLQGGAAADTFTVGDGVDFAGSINGGGGADLVRIIGTGHVDGAINGGTPGTTPDVLDESFATGPLVITLSPTAVSNFGEILGNGSTTLVGPDTGAGWVLDGPGAGSVNDTSFTGVTRVIGGAGPDTFNLAGGTLSGGITDSGAAASNTLVNTTTAGLVWSIDGPNAGQVFTPSGVVAFDVVGNLIGGAGGGDQFDLNGGSLSGGITGGGNPASNLLVNATGAGLRWNIDGPDAGRVINAASDKFLVAFTGVGNLQGGTAGDQFFLGGSLSGGITGVGNPAGNALVDATTAGLLWYIDGPDAGRVFNAVSGFHLVAFAGVGTLIGGVGGDQFALNGGSLSGGITGGNPATKALVNNTTAGLVWSINGPDAGRVSTPSGVVAFSGVGNLVGGLDGGDQFQLASGGLITGAILGRGPASSNELQVASASGTIVNWELTGQDEGDVIIPGNPGFRFAGIGNLVGGDGSDRFLLEGGRLSGKVDGGGGPASDFVILNVPGGLRWDVTGQDSGQVSDGIGLITQFVRVGNLVGGNLNDNFYIHPGGSLSGILDGGGGTDTIYYYAGLLIAKDPHDPQAGLLYTLDAHGNIVPVVRYRGISLLFPF
jgi:acrosin